MERTRSTKKGLLFKEESKKTYFFKESIVYPFVQFSTLKMELYLTNNDFADILAFVEQTGMASLTSLLKHLKDTIHCLLTLAYAIFCFVPNNFIPSNPSCPDPGRREKINLNLYFHTLWCFSFTFSSKFH